jgi:hypothetical protein
MTVRDRVENALRAWNAYEIERGTSPVIDYYCVPEHTAYIQPVGRFETLAILNNLKAQALDSGDAAVASNVHAHASYIRALLGERISIDQYIRDTQGCPAKGWPTSHFESVRFEAIKAVEDLGITWSPNTEKDLEAQEGQLTLAEAVDAIRHEASVHEEAVRAITGSNAEFNLNIETVDVRSYWSYWLDGVGSDVRLRLNLRNARFTRVQARQFALHEVLGHALQSASYARRCQDLDVPRVRILAVHTPYQVMMEGLAQALPLFVCRDDPELIARVRIDHLRQLTFAALHLDINNGESVEKCYRFATDIMPFWSTARIADALSDRSTDPQLRSYLWAYPAGLDWFATLAARGSRIEVQEVLHAAYHDPLCPAELETLWPSGPTIGGV